MVEEEGDAKFLRPSHSGVTFLTLFAVWEGGPHKKGKQSLFSETDLHLFNVHFFLTCSFIDPW